MSAFANLSVVVAEDNTNMRHVLCKLLSTFGVASITEAECGEQAIEVLRHHPSDVLITDCHMTPVDGVELTRWVREAEDSPDAFMPIVMISSLNETHQQRAVDAGVNHFIPKPIRPKDLLMVVHRVVHQPQPFIRTESYFGPDRRHPGRQAMPYLDRPDRRLRDSLPLLPDTVLQGDENDPKAVLGS